MADLPDITKQIERSRSILTNLLKHVQPEARETHLAKLASAYQETIDDVLTTIDTSPPVSLRLPKKPSATALKRPEPHVHSPTCEHIQAAVSDASHASVPGAIRAVLASERDGLIVRSVVAGVALLRPGTSDALVHGSLHAMRKRGELIRRTANGQTFYLLNPDFDADADATSATSRDGPQGGELAH